MIIIDCDQLSEEWFLARCGIPTASRFSDIITTKGVPSKSAQKYMYRLAAERIKGVKLDSYTSYDMRRGVENEPQAIATYEWNNNVDVQRVGLCFRDEKRLYSCSPDSLVGADGGVEIKDAKEEIQIDRLINGWSESSHFQQIQGCMFVTGRKWWDRVSNCEGLPQLVTRYERDQEFHIKLSVALQDFCAELDLVEQRLRQMT